MFLNMKVFLLEVLTRMYIELEDVDGRLEDMLIEISERNEISCFELPVYIQEGNNNYIDPEEVDAHNFSRIIRATPSDLENRDFFFDRKNSEYAIGISSKVKINGFREAHLRHLDIDYLPNPSEAPELFEESIKRLFSFLYERERRMRIDQSLLFPVYQKRTNLGFLVNSGNGLHYHALVTVGDKRCKYWIKKKKKRSEIEDNWCDIQLKRGFSILRMTSSSIKKNSPRLSYRVRARPNS